MIECVAHFFYQRLERNEVEHYACHVQLAFDDDGDLIVVAMERFPSAIGKNQEMGRGKVEIILPDLDAESFWHKRTLSKSNLRCKRVNRHGGNNVTPTETLDLKKRDASLARAPEGKRLFLRSKME